ncbi:DUF1840 domain-containing protein [Legionella impletisoli]|uniref:DUF1840 domain-containing protein n=1 Tax=Legionella impletisoli TaxID=343510 RepID=A0A917NBE7_9GAMM|nr:DUF1840 domain-containing protein [Legionella impletisoli]GGI85415.1 hypothetical protein GCM10007966_12570 [Legionella impletisoli]
MLVTFSCDAHENITMFGDVAVKLIKMMGHSGEVPSAILAEDVPNALNRLKQSLATHKEPINQTPDYQEENSEDEPVSLSNRAWPLIELLEDAAKAQCNVMWRKA